MQVTCLPVPGLVRSMELTVILQCLALVTADAIAQCLALLCISQCARAAAKSAHMDSGAWLFNLPIPAFLMMATLCHCVLLEVNSFWCSTYNRTWPLCVGGGHWPDAKTFSDEWTALLRRCSLRKPFLICSSNLCHTTFDFVALYSAAEYAALSYTVCLSAWRPWWGRCRLLHRESPLWRHTIHLACALWDLSSSLVYFSDCCQYLPWCPGMGLPPIVGGGRWNTYIITAFEDISRWILSPFLRWRC